MEVLKSADKELLVILPAFNEQDSIGGFLDTIKSSGIIDFADVLVINDGSEDNTSRIVQDKSIRIITHIYNLGYGCALQTGYKFAVRHGYKYLIQIDSDGQHDVCNIPALYKALKTPDAPDIVIGSRFFRSSKSFKISSIKLLTLKLFKSIIKFSTKETIKDPTSGLQGLNRKAFLHYSFYNNFVYDYPDANMIIQMLLRGFRIKEVPAVMHARTTGKSMHSGLKPLIYMMKITVSVITVILRESVFSKNKNK